MTAEEGSLPISQNKYGAGLEIIIFRYCTNRGVISTFASRNIKDNEQ